MGLFRKRDTRAQTHETQSHGNAVYSLHARHRTKSTDKLSDYSLKSPSLITTSSLHSAMANSIPEIDIPPAPDPIKNPAQYLRSIYAVRERSTIVLDKAKRDQLNHFDVDMTKFQDTADYVVSIIKVSLVPCRLCFMLTSFSVILHLIIVRYHLMVDGNISRLVVDHA